MHMHTDSARAVTDSMQQDSPTPKLSRPLQVCCLTRIISVNLKKKHFYATLTIGIEE